MVDEEVARRLADAVKGRRLELGLSQDGVATTARQAGYQLSAQTMREIEQGRRSSVSARTVVALEHALGWSSGSVALVQAGEHPEPVAVPTDDVAELRRELRELRDAVLGEPKIDDVRTVAGVLRMFSPEQRRVFAEALALVDATGG
jgi:transcriptional regulator with XRE-family HTH domain